MRLSVGAIVITGFAAFAVSIWILGCSNSSKSGIASGGTFSAFEQMQPQTLPYARAYLILGGTPEETIIETVSRTGEVDFNLLIEDTIVEQEFYGYDDKSFRFLGNTHERFEPGIPLLRFPMKAGEDWSWGGKYTFAEREMDAEATISTELDTIDTLAGQFETVLVIVNVEVDADAVEPVKFERKFWFVPKRGIIRREFEHSGTREPMPASDTVDE